jgi:hypothetical protein
MIHDFIVQNAHTNYISTFGDDGTKDFVLDKITFGDLNVERYAYDVIDQIGQTLAGIKIGVRDMTITGYVIADDVKTYLGMNWSDYYKKKEASIEEKKDVLNLMFNPLEDCVFTFGEYQITGRPDGVVKFGDTIKTNNDVLCYFSLSLICYEPYFRKIDSEIIPFIYVSGGFIFPWILKDEAIMGEIVEYESKTITNDSAIDVGCTITFSADYGKVRNPSFYNVSTGEEIKLYADLNKGDYCIINTNDGEQSATLYSEGYKTNVLSKLGGDSVFLKIRRGSYTYGASTDDLEERDENDKLVNYGKLPMTVKIEYNNMKFNLPNQ